VKIITNKCLTLRLFYDIVKGIKEGKEDNMKLTCCKWNAQGNKTVEITPRRIYENEQGRISILIDSATWKKIRKACGKDTDSGFMNEDKKMVEIISV
jgi:hypothetical protein